MSTVDSLTATAPPDPLVGMTIDGRYLVEKVLGEGGMGLVYRARHVVLNKLLAVKVLRAEVTHNPQVIARFRQEAQSASAIGNQHIIDVSDFGTLPDGSTYFVMEFLDGSSVTDVIEKEAPLAIPRFVHVLRQLCTALGAAHGAGIIHRDLKPDNIFLVRRGGDPDFVKVLDFGIAKVGGSSSKLTQAGQVFGTPHYMAPEQCQGIAVDPRADIYSLGIIAFELLTGKLPFDADTLMGILTAHLTEPAPPPSSKRPDVPPALDQIVLRCLAKSPDQRYADCRALLADLDAFAAGMPTTPRISGIVESQRLTAASRLPSAVPSQPPGAANRRGLVAGLGLGLTGLLALTVGAGVLLGRHSNETHDAQHQLQITMPTLGNAAAAGAASGAPGAAGAGTQPGTAGAQAGNATNAAAQGTSSAQPTIRIFTEPTGAEVLVANSLIGTTPLDLPRPATGERREIVLRAQGYADYPVVLSSLTVATELRLTLRRNSPAPRASQPATARPSRPAAAAPAPAPAAEPPRRRPSGEVLNPWGN